MEKQEENKNINKDICFHCGSYNKHPLEHKINGVVKYFCCMGCKTACELIYYSGADSYYETRDIDEIKPLSDKENKFPFESSFFREKYIEKKDDSLEMKKAYSCRDRWNIANKVALNPRYLLSEQELASMGYTLTKDADFDDRQAKYQNYIEKTVGTHKYQLMVESVRKSYIDYRMELQSLENSLKDQLTRKLITKEDYDGMILEFKTKYDPIVAAEYNFNPTIANSVAKKLNKTVDKVIISDKYVKLVPRKFLGDKSKFETNKGLTNFYDDNMQKFYDNKDYRIIDFIEHVNDLLYTGVNLIPEEKRKGLTARTLPFIEADLLQQLVKEPISLLGMKNRISAVADSVRSLAAYSPMTSYSNVPNDYVSFNNVDNKSREIKEMISLRVKNFYAEKGIDSTSIKNYVNKVHQNTELYYPTVYENAKQAVYDEVNTNRNFDLVTILGMYSQQIFHYKAKSTNSDEIGLLADAVEHRLSHRGVVSINGDKVEDIEHSEISPANNRLDSFRNFLNTYRNLRTNTPTLAIKNVRGKLFSKFEKQVLNELKSYKSKLDNNLSKQDLTSEQEEFYKSELAKVNEKINELGKDVYLIDSLVAPMIVFTQLKGLGWNFISYLYNVTIGQLNNYYESKDGRVFTSKAYKDSLKDIVKHSSGGRFGIAVMGMFAGAILSPSIALGATLGFTSGIAIGKLAQKYFDQNNKEAKKDVDKVHNFFNKHDLLNKVANETYRSFNYSNPDSSSRIYKIKNSNFGTILTEYFSLYRSTEAAEDMNQGVLGMSYLRSTYTKDIEGNDVLLIDIIDDEGNIDFSKLPQSISFSGKKYSQQDFQNKVVTEIRNSIRRTQGDYDTLFKTIIKNKVIGKAVIQFKTWMVELLLKDFESAKKDIALTDKMTDDAFIRKGTYVSLIEKAGLFDTSVIFGGSTMLPLIFTSLVSGSFFPAIVLSMGSAGVLYKLNKKTDKNIDPRVRQSLLNAVFKELPFIKKIYGSKDPDSYFSDLVDNNIKSEDAANFRALSAKLRVNISLLSMYIFFLILKEMGSDDDDENNNVLKKLSYALLNIAGKTYSDNSFTLDPTSSYERMSSLKTIIPSISTGATLYDATINPNIVGKTYERDQYAKKPYGYKKGDSKQIVALQKVLAGPNRLGQLEYMLNNKYKMFDLGN